MYELEQITDHIWILPRDSDQAVPQPNLGIICTPRETVLVDAGNSPRHARQVMSALSMIDAPPVDYLIYTHYHWDHVFGAMVYPVPHIVAHRMTDDLLRPFASRAWNATTLREEVYRNPRLGTRNTAMNRAIDDWRNFRVVLPTVTFAHTMTLYLDGLTIDLEHVGGRHAPDSIVVKLREPRVMFLGDSYYPPPTHERITNNDTLIDIEMLQKLVSDDFDTYIDGHGLPLARDEAHKMMQNLRQQADYQ